MVSWATACGELPLKQGYVAVARASIRMSRKPASYRFRRRSKCPACQSSEVIGLFECAFNRGTIGQFVRRYYGIDPELLSDATFEVVRCANCTLLFQGWVGDDDLLNDLYGNWINDVNHPSREGIYDALLRHPLESRDAHEILTASYFLGKSPTELTTLDYGMGWALWARISLTLGCRSFGTDLSAARRSYAEMHGVKTLTDKDIPVDHFDFINAEQVMEHVVDLHDVAFRLSAALRPGGILKISVPSADNLAPILGKLREGSFFSDKEIMPIQPLEHVNSFTKKSLHHLSRRFGLNPVTPSVKQRYSFLLKDGSLNFLRPRNALKELIRPLYTYVNPHNIYVWLQKSYKP